MAADSRSTHTDALATLGTIINEGEKRDAIHLGVEPIVAGENLRPGQHVGIGSDGKAYSGAIECTIEINIKNVGIVDPFIVKRGGIKKGERFWLIVYPRQITSLRHVWEHPDFPDSQETGTNITTKPAEEVEEIDPEKLHKMHLLLGEPKAEAKQRIMDWCQNNDVEYDEMMQNAKTHTKDDWHYWQEGGRFEGTSIYETFWHDYKLVTGEAIEPNKLGNFFSCSC